MRNTMIAIDGNSLLHRAFYAIPLLSNKKGVYTNALFGFLNMLIKLVEDHKPCTLAVAFDKKGPTFRHKAYGPYKATRQKAPEELIPQLELARELVSNLNIPIYEIDGYEADDILGTISRKADENRIPILLVTGDRDALQLVSENTCVLLTQKGISVTRRFDEAELYKEYGLTPRQFIDMKGLMGDSSDNIPGVPGIGQKTAVKLLAEYGSLENILDNIDNISGKKLKENLVLYRHIAMLSKELATIYREVPIDIAFSSEPYEFPRTAQLKDFLAELELNSIINKLGLEDLKTKTKAAATSETVKTKKTYHDLYDLKDVFLLADQLYRQKEVAIMAGKVMTVASCPDEVYRIHFREDLLGNGVDYYECLNALKPVFENSKVSKIMHDSKKAILELARYDIRITGLSFDTMIGAYLLDPTRNKYAPEQLLYDYLRHDTNEADAGDILELAECMANELDKLGMGDLYYMIEHPLIPVLADMELTGFKVDKQKLSELDVIFSSEVARLTEEIISLAGIGFNINSTRQLGEVLFEKLGLPVQKKTKTGYSTDIEVLERLLGVHPIIEKLIEYRQMTKLKSTYIDGLLQVIDKSDGKIHSSFNQAVTATGRISSTEPNLQNIPVKLALGRQIRKVFTASSSDHVLLDADYSQIELRVLAHISQDPILIESFRNNEDIHRRTASEILGIPMDRVTDEQRSSAKAVNFGIVYGISDFGLARNLRISRAKAKMYIDSYLSRYSKVKEYMERIVEEGRNNGYVTTLFNRRRELPELRSRNFNIRSFGERIALNTPIQGTAADIIKIAMVNVYNALKRKGLRSKLILQVHDELILDVYKPELDEVKAIVKHEMETAAQLLVPLVVDIGTGNTWYDAK
ncbi:MAG TPA: DNA polymerase I [Candidatus Atribacteria bacterium]|nr:DNA polymerase I [Candidatus Atribacteria bacterium]